MAGYNALVSTHTSIEFTGRRCAAGSREQICTIIVHIWGGVGRNVLAGSVKGSVAR